MVIARDGAPVARIVPERRPSRIQLGRDEGRATTGPDFDEPLPEFDEYSR